jgi:hypothetical protein
MHALTVFVRSLTHSASKLLHETAPHAGSVLAARHSPVVAHVSQVPLHAELQHTPSTQLLLLHSAPVLHAAPLPFLGCEQLPALSHRLVALQAWPALRALPWQSCPALPQRPATQRCAVTLGGKSRQVVSAGQAMAPQSASSSRLVHAVPVSPQTRHGPSQTAVQQTLPPAAVSWHVPSPQSASEPQAWPALAKHPARGTLQPSAPQASSVIHCPALQR